MSKPLGPTPIPEGRLNSDLRFALLHLPNSPSPYFPQFRSAQHVFSLVHLGSSRRHHALEKRSSTSPCDLVHGCNQPLLRAVVGVMAAQSNPTRSQGALRLGRTARGRHSCPGASVWSDGGVERPQFNLLAPGYRKLDLVEPNGDETKIVATTPSTTTTTRAWAEGWVGVRRIVKWEW